MWIESLITVNPQIMAGQPVFAGTRILVETIASLRARFSVDEVLEMYPDLTVQNVEDAVTYWRHQQAREQRPKSERTIIRIVSVETD